MKGAKRSNTVMASAVSQKHSFYKQSCKTDQVHDFDSHWAVGEETGFAPPSLGVACTLLVSLCITS